MESVALNDCLVRADALAMWSHHLQSKGVKKGSNTHFWGTRGGGGGDALSRIERLYSRKIARELSASTLHITRELQQTRKRERDSGIKCDQIG